MFKRKQHAPEFKAKGVLEALKGAQKMTELASQFGVRPTMIHNWEKARRKGLACFTASARRPWKAMSSFWKRRSSVSVG